MLRTQDCVLNSMLCALYILINKYTIFLLNFIEISCNEIKIWLLETLRHNSDMNEISGNNRKLVDKRRLMVLSHIDRHFYNDCCLKPSLLKKVFYVTGN